MTSIEDWSLSTLSSQIFRQQTQLQLRSGNSNFLVGGRPSWKATGLQLQSGNSRFLGAGPDRATTAIWELEIFWWQAQLKGERATTAIWELVVFWWQAQCMSSCIALLSPEVRWSEMEWHVSLVLASRLSVRCEMNGLFYTSIFYRNECGGFHVRRAMVCGWLFTLGTLLFR